MKLFKKLLGGVICGAIVVVLAIGVGRSRPTGPTPNAVWLDEDYEYQWISYQILEKNGSHLIQIGLPEDTQLYSACPKGKTDVRKSSKDKIWICEDSLYPKHCYYHYWSALAPTPDSTLSFEAFAGSELYADLGQRKWLYFRIPDDKVIPSLGLLKAELRKGKTENDIIGRIAIR